MAGRGKVDFLLGSAALMWGTPSLSYAPALPRPCSLLPNPPTRACSPVLWLWCCSNAPPPSFFIKLTSI